jgi:hypothetical protein
LGIISIAEVQKVLEPYRNDVLACIEESWKQCRDQFIPLVPRAHGRFRPNAMAALVENQVRVRFGDVGSKVHVLSKGQRLLVGFQGKFFLHFKQMDADRLTRNFQTRTAKRFERQEYTVEYGDVPRVTVGYRLNSLGTELLEVVVLFRFQGKLLWEFPLVGTARVHQLELGDASVPETESTATQPASQGQEAPAPEIRPRRRVKVKPEALPEKPD